MGFLIIFLLSLILYLVGFYQIWLLAILVLAWSLAGLFFPKLKRPRISRYHLLAVGSGLVLAGALSYFSPYPYLNDLDPFRHVDFISQILAGQFVFAPAYLPGFHTLVALLTFIFGFSGEPYLFFWAARFLAFPAFALGIYLFLEKITQHQKISLFLAFLAPLFTLEYIDLSTTAPKVLSWVILPYFLYLIWDLKKDKIATLVIIVLTGLLIHWPMGLANLTVILSFLIFRYLFSHYPKIAKKLIAVISFLTLAFLLVQYFKILNLNQISFSIFGELDLKKYSFDSNLTALQSYFAPVILGLVVLGLLWRRSKAEILFLPGFCFILSAYFLPLNASQRLLVSLLPLLLLFIAGALIELSHFTKVPKLFFSIALPLLLVCFINPYYQSIKENIKLDENEGRYTLISPDEFRAAGWINENIDSDFYLITDPVNLTFFSGLTQAQALLSAEEAMKNIFIKKRALAGVDFIKTKNPEHPVYIYIDGRTGFWIRERKNKEIFYAPNKAKTFAYFDQFKKFADSQYFKIIYSRDQDYYLIEVL